MSSRIFPILESLEWKRAYLAAVLERNRTHIPELVHAAKEKLLQRIDELRMSDSVPCGESEAIDDAWYLLDALLGSVRHRHDIDQWPTWDLDS